MKRTHTIVRLIFRSPFHVGKPGVGLEASMAHIPSDTLFSAICHAWQLLWGTDSLQALLDAFINRDTVPFRLSSAFPHIDGRHFLPRPYSSGNILPAMMSEEVKKKMKDVDFLPCDLFENWIAWQVLGAPEFNAIDQARSQLDDVIEKEQRPRNRIDRVTEQIDLYFCETVNIRESGGLYLLVQTEDDRADALRACLEFLGQELGVGGERKLGLGRFDCDWGELEVEEPDSPTHFLTLSSYFPNPAEQGKLDELVHAYELVRRSGFSGSFSDTGQVKRCSCRMFKEGSVFNEEAKGQLVAVTPANVEVSHPIYRSGLAYTIGVRIEAQS